MIATATMTATAKRIGPIVLMMASGLAWPSLTLAAEAVAPGMHKRREPPPVVIPTEEVKAAQKLYDTRNYEGAVAKAKAALNKNERYTPAMLVMAKAYFKLGKNEWVKTLGDMMKNAGASDAAGECFAMRGCKKCFFHLRMTRAAELDGSCSCMFCSVGLECNHIVRSMTLFT